jgi:hypothetical protein
MNQNRQPKGIPTGGRFAGRLHPESPMEPAGRLAGSADKTLSRNALRGVWVDTLKLGRTLVSNGDLDLAQAAQRNLAKNPSTPSDVLHEMFVEREDGKNKVPANRLGWGSESEAMSAAIQHPKMPSETLHLIARSGEHEKQSVEAAGKLKERRRRSLRGRIEVYGAGRRAGTVTLEQLKDAN